MRHICLYIGVQIFIARAQAGPPEVVQEALADLKSMQFLSLIEMFKAPFGLFSYGPVRSDLQQQADHLACPANPMEGSL